MTRRETGRAMAKGEPASIVPARSDLLTGGARFLYLGWLLRVQAGEVAEHVTEPEVPPGLARLSGGAAALVEFLRIDHHLIAAAVQKRSGRPAQARAVGDLSSIAKRAEKRPSNCCRAGWLMGLGST